MSKKLLIIGAGNIGGFISYNSAIFGDYEVLGFLDDDPNKADKIFYGNKVLGAVNTIDSYLGDEPLSVVIGIANPIFKSKIARMLATKKVDFPNFIAPNVWISNKVSLGKGIILYPGVSINYECTLQDFVIMNMNCAIGHNCTISEYSTLAPGVNLAGFTKIMPCADIGIGATTIQGITVGSNSRIGGQSMLIKNIPDNSVAVGNPSRIIRKLDQ